MTQNACDQSKHLSEEGASSRSDGPFKLRMIAESSDLRPSGERAELPSARREGSPIAPLTGGSPGAFAAVCAGIPVGVDQLISVRPVAGGWSVTSPALGQPMAFLTSARAEQHARSLAEAFAKCGHSPRIIVHHNMEG